MQPLFTQEFTFRFIIFLSHITLSYICATNLGVLYTQKTNLIIWNPYIVGLRELYYYNLPRDMPSEGVRKTANWDSLFDTCKVKIATLIRIYNCITPLCVDHTIQRKESKHDLRQQCVSVQCFKTYCAKNSISHRGSIVWNLLEPSAVHARDYAKKAK